MDLLNIQFIIDEKGKKSTVGLPMKTYFDLLDKLEVLEDISLYDEVKSLEEPSISLAYRRKRFI